MEETTTRILTEFCRRYPTLAHLRQPVARAAKILSACAASRGLILVCGNGGSAADSDHIVGELIKGLGMRRPLSPSTVRRMVAVGMSQRMAARLQEGVRAISLCSNASALTATANDLHPDLVFAQQVCSLGSRGDVLLALSTSGTSRNVVAALKAAKALGLSTIGMTGALPCAMDRICDIVLKVPAQTTAEVQEQHVPVYHLLCRLVEARLF